LNKPNNRCMIERFLNWMFDYGSAFLLFPLAMAVWRYKYLTHELVYVAAFLGLSLLGELVATVLSALGINNLFVLHFYTMLEFSLIALFYQRFFGGYYPRWFVPTLLVVFIAFAVINLLFIQSLSEFNTYARGLEGLLTIVLAMMCFYKMLMELESKRPEKHPVFWINAGYLFYFAGSLFLFILSNVVLKENKSFNFMFWGFHACLFALMHLFIGIGLWYSPRQN